MNNLKQPYIGSEVFVEESKNKTLIGLKGKIIDETKNTFIIKLDDGKIKTLLKNASDFIIDNKKINGEKITKKPYERIKIKNKK